MAVLTEFTKEMLLRSSYGDERVAVEIAKKCANFYLNNLCNETCKSRYKSLINIIEDLSG
ncbi:hypothetical protein [Aeromonas phage 51]|nr:hypothetical protein [Aeromonas phage 51]APU01339.1 hypothetical protein [Aeromonas phage 56]